jgi:hypothetical protein
VVDFALGDVLSTNLRAQVGECDVLFAQNFLFHMRQSVAKRALENILSLASPGAALFIDGVDLDLRQRFVRARKLTPVEDDIEKIHEEARRARSSGWPYEYWGLEPFKTYPKDWRTRYATIFLVP